MLKVSYLREIVTKEEHYVYNAWKFIVSDAQNKRPHEVD